MVFVRFVAALFLAGCLASASAAGLPSANVAWVPAATDADVDRAFAAARPQGKPVLVYWGATWCPPCNQLKATLFNRQDFALQAKSFVAVHVDGDRPGAQRLGQRFKVSGYPTVVLFKPDGTEITRLPGDADAEQVMAVLRLGLSGGRPVKSVLADVRDGKPLAANEWRLLAFYSWETDEQRLVPKGDVAGLLAQLAVASGSSAADKETTTRLWLKAIAASDDGKGVKADDPMRRLVHAVLADPALTRTQMDVLAGSAAPAIVRTLADDDAPERAPLVAAFEAALQRLQGDTTLSRSDRLAALVSRIELARLAEPKGAARVKLPEPLLREVREQVGRADREITDGYERQAVITYAAYALGRAGLWDDSDALLRGNLARSHSPYYLMSQLGGNARKLGRNDEALRWYGQAFDRSEGPATRLQWGAGYLGALVDLAPRDGARIEKVASQLLAEAAKDPGAFYERSARSLQRIGTKLVAWSKDSQNAAAVKRLQAQLDAVCQRLPAADGRRQTCRSVLSPAKPEA